MGASLSKVFSKVFGSRQVRIFMGGLDSAGKTTILYQLKLGEVTTTIPTIGFNVETLEHKNIQFIAWDMGGRGQIRPLWRHFLQNIQGIVFVVDSTDTDRMREVRDELARLMNEDEVRNAVLLVIANKRDLPRSESSVDIASKLELSRIVPKSVPWNIMECCATSGDGLLEALQWLSDAMAEKLAADPTFGLDLPPLIRQADKTEEFNPSELAAGSNAFVSPVYSEEARRRLKESFGANLSDSDFLAAFESKAVTPKQLGHEEKLRVTWLYLRSVTDRSKGRKAAVSKILDGLAEFYRHHTEHGVSGAKFHLTHAYFWLQMVDLCIHSAHSAHHQPLSGLEGPPAAHPDFASFLSFIADNPFLVNESLIFTYYSAALIFGRDSKADNEFVLPDMKPLPSILSFNRQLLVVDVVTPHSEKSVEVK